MELAKELESELKQVQERGRGQEQELGQGREQGYGLLVEYTEGISFERLEQLLAGIGEVRAGVIGDICLDVYWTADLKRSTLSRETPHYTLPIVGERYSLGAAGNVAANLAALGCKQVSMCSVVGEDWRGRMLMELMAAHGIDASGVLASSEWVTPAYCKPILTGLQNVQQEAARLDFQNFSPLPTALAVQLDGRLDAMAECCDVIAVTDQLPCGVVGESIRARLASWAFRGKIVVVDSRERIGLYRGIVVKPNEVEASEWFGEAPAPRGREQWAAMARRLAVEVQGPVCMTLGSEGAIWVNGTAGQQGLFVPSRKVAPPVDIVGAGDAYAAAMLAAMGAGGTAAEALVLGHSASSIVIRKLGTTGCATPEEIRAVVG